MTTQYGPGDPETCSKQPDDNTVERYDSLEHYGLPLEPPIELLTTDDFVAKVWEVLADNSPAIDEAILGMRAYDSMYAISWVGVMREMFAAVIKVMQDEVS